MDNPTHKEFVELLKQYYPRSWKHWAEENDILYDHTPREELSNKTINKLALSVTPSIEIADWAIENGCNAVLVHHPYGSTDPIPSYAVHTRADRGLINVNKNEKIGINQLWGRYLGLKNMRQVDDIYMVGDFEKPLTFEEADKRVSAVIQHSCNVLGDKIEYTTIAGQKFTRGGLIKTVNVCSGMGGIVLGVNEDYRPDKEIDHPDYADLFLTGQLTRKATDDNQNFEHVMECGHTMNERLILVAWKIIFGKLFPKLEIVAVPAGIDFWTGDPKFAFVT